MIRLRFMRPTILFASAVLFCGHLLADVRGIVMTTDGRALPNARVQAFKPESWDEYHRRIRSSEPDRVTVTSTASAANGRFVVETTEPVVELLIDAPGYVPYGIRVAGDDDAGAIPLRRATTKRGHLKANGKAVADAILVFTGIPDVVYQVRSDAEGGFSVPDPEIWQPSVAVFHPDFPSFSHDAARLKRNLELSFGRGVRIAGSVVAKDGSTGVAGATIRVDGVILGISSEGGAFDIGPVTPSWKAVRAETATDAGERVNEKRAAYPIRLQPAAVLSGAVRDSRTGKALAGATVFLATGEVSRQTISDKDGKYAFRSLAPERATVQVTIPGFGNQYVPVSLTGGAAITKDFKLSRLSQAAGSAMSDDDTPVAAAMIRARKGFSEHGIRVWSGPDGSFVMKELEPDVDYTLEAAKKGLPTGKAPAFRVAAGERKTGLKVLVPAGIALTGRVSDRDNHPVAGVAVRAWESDERVRYSRRQDPAEEQVTTDADGAFTIRVVPGKYDLWLVARGFAQKRLPGITVSLTPEPLAIQLEPSADISGRLVRPDGTALQGARVFVTISVFNSEGTETGPDGSFTLTGLSRGPVDLYFLKEDELIDFQHNLTAPAKDVVVEVPGGGRISGRVLDKKTKAPVTDFQAGVAGERSGGGMMRMGPPMLRTFRSEDGAFTLEYVPVGTTELEVHAPGYARARVPGIKVEEGKAISGLEVMLEQGVRLTGKITGENGAPVEGAVVTSDRLSVGPRGFSEMASRSDSDGEYVLEDLESGDRNLNVTKTGFATWRKQVKISGREVRHDVQLEKGVAITGTVVNESGVPVADATLHAASASQRGYSPMVRSDSAGRFTLEGLMPGRYTIMAMRDGYTREEIKDVDLAAIPRDLTITLKRGATIYGRLTGLTEELGRVTVSAGAGNVWSRTSPGPDGTYRLEGAPVGTIRVRAEYFSMTGSRSSEPKMIDVTAGSEHQVDLEFTSDIVIRGTVTREGRPVANHSVYFSSKDGIASDAGAAIGRDGTYEVAGLKDGLYNVHVMSQENYRTFRTTYQVRGSGTFDIDMTGGTIRGMVVDSATSEPLPDAAVSLSKTGEPISQMTRQAVRSGPDGTFEFELLGDGEYDVSAVKDQYAAVARKTRIEASSDAELEFALKKEAPVLLRVVDARDGRALRAWAGVETLDRRPVIDAHGDATDVISLPLEPGNYRLIVAAGRYAPRLLTISVPSAEIRVALSPGGALAIRSGAASRKAKLLFPSGDLVPIQSWRYFDLPLTIGTTLRENIAPGNYTLQILDNRGSVEKTVPIVIAEGQTTAVSAD